MIITDIGRKTVMGQGAGPDETHLPLQDIHQLRHLIQVQHADNPAHPGNAGVVIYGKRRAALGGILHHGPEFQYLEAQPFWPRRVWRKKTGP